MIEAKIEELIALAKLEGDDNTQIVLLTLLGAKTAGVDEMLATHLQKYTSEVLLPMLKEAQAMKKVIQN
jgi:hypothetical protein